MKTILVTGGAGFIGSHMVKLLLNHHYNVIILDNLSKGHRESILGGELIVGDLNDKEILKKIFTLYNIDAVIHFAAFIEVGESTQNPAKYYQNNVSNTINLLQAMAENNVNYIVFSSSAAIFGEPNYTPIGESHPKLPLNPYGSSKLIVEQLFRDFETAHGLKHISLRYFNASGADLEGALGECHQPETHLIPLLLEVASGKREYISIYGNDYPTPDGTCIRDYIHVVDLCEAHLLSLEKLFKGDESTAYNLGTGHGYSVTEIVKSVRDITGKTIAIKMAPKRPGDPARLVADPTKAREELNWSPKYSTLKTIISSAWNYHCQQTHCIG